MIGTEARVTTCISRSEPLSTRVGSGALPSGKVAVATFQKGRDIVSKSPNDVNKLVQDSKIEIIDLRFVDLPGVWQHFSLPARELSDDWFEDGLGFDGSSIRGYQQIQESDMLLFPDPDTAYVDPILQIPTLSMICSVKDPVTRERYTRDPRYIAQKAEEYLKSTGIADISYWGPEAEFYIFDDVRYDQTAQGAF